MTKQTNPIPVAVYVRVSSDRQDMVLSIGGQLKSLKEYADNNGYVVVREFVDEAESGRNADRPQFRAMIAEANGTDAPFEAILVWKFSRFARSREHSVVFKSMLKRRNIRVISISESAEENPTGELLEGIIEIIDEFYSKNMAQDIMRGMREASARGFWITAFAPLGYRKEYVQDGTKRRTKLVLDPPADALVKRMFDMAEAGNSLLDIAKALNGEGFTTARGYRWMTTGVHKDPLQRGVYRHCCLGAECQGWPSAGARRGRVPGDRLSRTVRARAEGARDEGARGDASPPHREQLHAERAAQVPDVPQALQCFAGQVWEVPLLHL